LPLWKRILYLYRFKFIQRIAGRSFWCLSIVEYDFVESTKQSILQNKTINKIWKQKNKTGKKYTWYWSNAVYILAFI
jgi:hypothetical protein